MSTLTDKQLEEMGLTPSSRDRFGWNDGDVVMRDDEGNEITPRQAKELQLQRLRSEVAEDLPDDSGGE